MEASAPAPASAALLLLLASPPRFLHLPPRPSARRLSRSVGGLLPRPPHLRRQDPGARARRTTSCCCLSSGGSVDFLLGGGSLVAAAALLAALQVIWLRWRGGRCFEQLVLPEDDIVNKALSTTKEVHDSNCAEQMTTHDNGFSELRVSGRMTVDEMHCKAPSFSCVNTVHKETQAYSVITPWTSLDTLVDISRPEEVYCSTPIVKTSYIKKVTSAPAIPQSVSRQNKSRCFSSRVGQVVGLPHQFLFLSGQKEVIQNGRGHNDKPMDNEDANYRTAYYASFNY